MGEIAERSGYLNYSLVYKAITAFEDALEESFETGYKSGRSDIKTEMHWTTYAKWCISKCIRNISDRLW